MSPAATRRFRIVIADHAEYEIVVEAPDEQTARDMVLDLLGSDEHPDATSQYCDIIGCTQVRS